MQFFRTGKLNSNSVLFGKARMSLPRYVDWLALRFPGESPLAERHHRVYQWFDTLAKGKSPDPLIECWCRGGAKSTTVQRATVRAALAGKRRFLMYVSATQEQAEEHLATIATMLEREGCTRLTNRYGHSKGFRRSMVRLSNGFNAVAVGLDTARRGIKLDDFRPDLIVIDDVDDPTDTPKTVHRKFTMISKALIPAGSVDCGVVFIQNLIHKDGVMAQLRDGRLEFLLKGKVPPIEPAVMGLEVEAQVGEDGRSRYRIVKGTPTWNGQDLAVCERQINEWGLRAFMQEAQHQVSNTTGFFFDVNAIKTVRTDELPEFVRVCRSWDRGATEGGGDPTVGALVGLAANGTVWILDIVRAQLSASSAKSLMVMVTAWDRSVYGGRYRCTVPRDPGAAGVEVAEEYARLLGASIMVTTGKKAVRAEKWADKANSGNARILVDGRQRTPEIDALLAEKTRNTEMEGRHLLYEAVFRREHDEFREDESHLHDDIVDAIADAVRKLLADTVTAAASRPVPEIRRAASDYVPR